MPTRSISVSCGNNESFTAERATQHSQISAYVNGAVVSLFNPNSSNSSSGAVTAFKQAASHEFEWLQPWRTPQDCREGGLALLYSIQEILANVQRARLSSLNEVYTPLRGPNRNSTSNHPTEVLDDNSNASFTLRLSMRNSKRRPRGSATTTTIVEGEGREARNGSMGSVGSILNGATLLDYMLPGNSSRQLSHMWLDEAKQPRRSFTTTAAEMSDEAKDVSGKSQSSWMSAVLSPFLQSVDARPLSQQQQQQQSPSMTSLEAKNDSTPPSVVVSHRASTVPVEETMKERNASHLHTEASAPAATVIPIIDVVPAIPRFDELKAAREEHLKLQQAHQAPHPRSEAAQRQQRALLHSSSEDGSRDVSPRAHLQVTARLPPNGGSCMNRPLLPQPPAPPLPLSSSASSSGADAKSGALSSPCDVQDVVKQEINDYKEEQNEEDEDEDDVSDCMSATNFGEGGHLACVPGDTLHNRYTLLKALGVGRSSRVWLAADLDQCSLVRRQLIRELGEREVRRLFRPDEHPMFVAVKVFRCSAMYTDCATYEAKLSTFVKDSMRLRQLRTVPRSPPPRSPSVEEEGNNSNSISGRPRANSNASSFAYTSAASLHPGRRLTMFRDAFTVDGQYGTHQCLVMDVLGSGVDKAINEAHLAGFPSEVARSIMLSTLQGLSVLAACNVIHTDLKPENLLFTDLEADVAAEMSAFQSSQLQTRQGSGLWSSFTHRRENVLEYSQRIERESTSQAELTANTSRLYSPTAAAAHKVETEEECERSHSSGQSETTNGHRHHNADYQHACESLLDSEGVSRSHYAATAPRNGVGQRQKDTLTTLNESCRRSMNTAAMTTTIKDAAVGGGSFSFSSSLLSPARPGGGSATPSPPRARRPAYEVRVSDFGLSFIVPPCLRLGVRAMARYTAEVGMTEDELVHDDALSQLQWLYEQQQQVQLHAQPSIRVVGRSASGTINTSGNSNAPRSNRCDIWEFGVATTPTVLHEWTTEGELVDEAELRALQLKEEAHLHYSDNCSNVDGPLHDTSSTEGRKANLQEEGETAEEGANGQLGEGAGESRAATHTAPAAGEFTSVVDVGVAATTAAAETHSKVHSKNGHLQRSTQPDLSLLNGDLSLYHSSNSTNSGLDDDRIRHHHTRAGSSAVNTSDSISMDHFTAAAASPPNALCTASYHSPVSNPLTALPSVAATAAGGMTVTDQSSSLLYSNRAEKSGRTTGMKNSQQVVRSPSLSPLPLSPHTFFYESASFYHRERHEQEKSEDALYAAPSPPVSLKSPSSTVPSPLRAPSLLSGRSGGAAEDNNRTMMKSMSFVLRSSMLRPPPLTNFPSTTISAETIETGDGNTAQQPDKKPAALVSPHQPRRSSTSALASLTALRRLELDIIRNQHYTRGAVIQSREYRAPEVLLGNFFLPSCDVWSIGCIAYELVTGRFLMDAIADREHFGRQLARHLRREGEEEQREKINMSSASDSYFDEAEKDANVEWDGEPIYVDDHEQDLDVFHLKAMMRLLGPPPLTFLAQRPVGLFVADYFDLDGNFKFWEAGEAEDCGMNLAEPYRCEEILYAGIGTSSGGDAVAAQIHSTNASEEHVIPLHYIYNTSEEKEKERAETPARSSGGSSYRVHGSLSNMVVVRSDYHSASSTDATPSTQSMIPRSFPTSAVSPYLRSAIHTTSSTSAGMKERSPIPLDTRNYPIKTPEWLEVKKVIRQKLKSADEARDFEHFLLKCLQWDPAQRATAAELLADDWMVKYSHKVAETVESDVDEDKEKINDSDVWTLGA